MKKILKHGIREKRSSKLLLLLDSILESNIAVMKRKEDVLWTIHVIQFAPFARKTRRDILGQTLDFISSGTLTKLVILLGVLDSRIRRLGKILKMRILERKVCFILIVINKMQTMGLVRYFGKPLKILLITKNCGWKLLLILLKK